MKKHLIFILFVILSLPSIIYAACTNGVADTTSMADVQECINEASPGDTITVPAGESTWTGYVNVTVDDITIQGNGIDSTIIHKYGFRVYHGIDNWRITGFTFDGDRSLKAYGDPKTILIGQSNSATGSKNWRIDNNKFIDCNDGGVSGGNGVYTIFIRGFSYGLIDNNTFDDCRGEVIVYCADGATADSRDFLTGEDDNGTIFIEDNVITLGSDNFGTSGGKGGNFVDGNSGSRYVFRYNTFTDSANVKMDSVLEQHGACYGCNGFYTSSLTAEIYENTFTTNNSFSYKRVAAYRGGFGVFYNNSLVGNWVGDDVYMLNVRSNPNSCTYGGGTEDTYVCDYQVGDLGDLYIWGNDDDGGAISVTSATSDIQVNRDYWLSALGGYTPYTYPHPLQNFGGDTTPPDRWYHWPNGEELSCSADPKIVNIQLYTDENATCKFSADGDGGDDTNTIYDNLNNTFTTTGGTWHADPESVACGSSFSYWVRCMDQSSNKNITSININGTVAPPPEPGAPGNLKIMELKGSTKSMDVGGTTKTFDIQ